MFVMLKVLEIFKKIFEFITSKQFLYMIIIGVIVYFSIVLRQNEKLKNEIIHKNHNIEALNDSIKSTNLKNGELQYSITSFISSENELKKINEVLYNKVKEQEGKVLSLSSALVNLRQDSILLARALKNSHDELSKINDSTFISNWVNNFVYDKSNFDEITGQTKINVNSTNPFTFNTTTNIVKKNSQIDLTFGYKMVDERLHVFIQSAYPGFTTKSLEGVYIDGLKTPGVTPKRHWFTGFSIGPSFTYGYDFSRNKLIPTIGVSVTYSIYQW